ncbi:MULTISPECIES: RNA-binding S4 domain-containing protein [unclassified Thioalkalivibrio]|uniref:RNA-binding S4 domain-containing protein n=1 Tax=unclassified Thioalkalivibrio TaxID=2621013 RepID=UPI0003670C00|nr:MULTISPECIES: S4 domain-containing protein [unclassified Thioalkalivibrio]
MSRTGAAATPASSLRLDKWLWAARFFKTRALATEAVSGGKVHVNGERCKPARKLHPGDRVRVHKGSWSMEVDVVALDDRRRPATEAEQLYTETPESRESREQEASRRRLEREARAPAPSGRPDKRERRKIRRFVRQDQGGTDE